MRCCAASCRALAAACLAAASLAPACAEDLLVAASYEDYARLRMQAAAWQEQTGRALIWLPPDEALAGAAADIHYLPAAPMLARIAAGEAAAITVAGSALPGRLAGAAFRAPDAEGGEAVYHALPQSIELPLLWVRADLAQAAGIAAADALGWEDVHGMAVLLDDPVAGVRGLCPPGAQQHAALVRAMIAESEGSWLQEGQDQAALSDDWLHAADRYARLLAAAAAPAAVRATAAEAAQQFANGACAMLLGSSRPPSGAAELIALPVPGAAALAWPTLRLIAVDPAAGSPAAAQELALWAALGRDPSADAAAAARLAARNPSARAALGRTLEQSAASAAEAGLDAAGLQQLDGLAAAGLRKVILGLLPAAEALAESGASRDG